ncbi:hypothetical protein GCM10010185_71090 [Saccharothrix coeruleofusca]|uniref:Uncharacterized protein n=1 Tax=Saccharothrix coeruleofusca TaxID=33919 RepID=A0A918ATU6_9PSEU|nr:hypothetical protein GCM10010185_71090 [Saccharothrix coeruleofusca]
MVGSNRFRQADSAAQNTALPVSCGSAVRLTFRADRVVGWSLTRRLVGSVRQVLLPLLSGDRITCRVAEVLGDARGVGLPQVHPDARSYDGKSLVVGAEREC